MIGRLLIKIFGVPDLFICLKCGSDRVGEEVGKSGMKKICLKCGCEELINTNSKEETKSRENELNIAMEKNWIIELVEKHYGSGKAQAVSDLLGESE